MIGSYSIILNFGLMRRKCLENRRIPGVVNLIGHFVKTPYIAVATGTCGLFFADNSYEKFGFKIKSFTARK